MSIWSDIQEGIISTKERLVNALEKITNKTELQDSDVQGDELIKVMKKIADDADIELLKIEDELLTKEETLLLQACTLLPFKIGSFSSIDDLLRKLDVSIQIAPDIKYHEAPSELLQEKDDWEKELKKRKEGSQEYNEILDILRKIQDEISVWQASPIRGEYLREDKIIKLYPEEMHKECDSGGGKHPGLSMYSLLVSTLAHESMHAYFDRTVCRSLPYVGHVEEPLAEFGMLLYLYYTHQEYIFNWARNDVRSKLTYYRYGDALMSLHLATADTNGDSLTRSDLERYKRPVF